MNRLASILTCCAVTLLLLDVGCGGRVVDEDSIRARNLQTGEIKEFPSEESVPPGYSPCSDPDCSVPDTVPCENLGDDVCTLNPNCRLKELWCSGSGTAEPGQPGGTEPVPMDEPGESNDDPGDAVPIPPPGEEECEYQCLPKLPLLCDELTDEQACLDRPDCEWVDGICPMIACQEGQDCDIECSKMCQPKAPPTCWDLDEQACLDRPDCEWGEEICPMIGCPEGEDCDIECSMTCKPVQPDPPPPPPTDPVCNTIIQDYAAAVQEAKACNPLVFMQQCTVTVDSHLICGCPTYVNPSNTAALSKIKQLEQQFLALPCPIPEYACAGCVAVSSATCSPDASGQGSCIDDQNF